MPSIAIFTDTYMDELQSKVNKWLSDKLAGSVLDIRLQLEQEVEYNTLYIIMVIMK